MRLTCKQCKKTLKIVHEDDPSTVLYHDDGVYLFCNKECKDRCDSSALLGAEAEDAYLPSQ